MLGIGMTREEIARESGYSLSHISRILRMPEARAETAAAAAHAAESLVGEFVIQVTNTRARTLRR